MNKAIHADNAPAAIGPYVHAVQAGNMVFTSGQIGLIPETGELAEGLEAQTRQVIQNLKAVLAASGMGLEDVVKTTVFVDNMLDFARVNEIYGEYFNENKPARSCVEAAALPKGALIEIEVIAVK